MSISSDTLHAATDRLNEAYAQAEEIFLARGFGVQARVSIPLGGSLMFARNGKAFEIMYENPHTHDIMRIVDVSREVRIAAAPFVHQLFDAALRAVDNEHTRVMRATKQLAAFITEA